VIPSLIATGANAQTVNSPSDSKRIEVLQIWEVSLRGSPPDRTP
jgi:hypothetical protein